MKRRKSRREMRAIKMRRARQKRWQDTPYGQFSKQRANARRRGVEWLLDFETWDRIWRESGHYAQRGRAPGNYQMARKKDAGPYADGNVIIVKLEANAYACLIESRCSRFNPESQFAAEVAAIL